MRICEKILMDRKGLEENGPITIVAFGDSVTHGSLSNGEIDYETVYWNRLKKKINEKRNYVPVNIINAGIGGVTAGTSIERMDKQVLAHNPDLIIVCFGLNDVNGTLDWYLESLETIFKKCIENGAETIFMTPNMMNTYVADDTNPELIEYATRTADYQNSGKMDKFIFEAIKVARSMGIKVCDCYSKWKEMSEKQDITKLLVNRINHPTREMHELFAQSLFDIIFEDVVLTDVKESTMYKTDK